MKYSRNKETDVLEVLEIKKFFAEGVGGRSKNGGGGGEGESIPN